VNDVFGEILKAEKFLALLFELHALLAKRLGQEAGQIGTARNPRRFIRARCEALHHRRLEKVRGISPHRPAPSSRKEQKQVAAVRKAIRRENKILATMITSR